MILPFNDKYVDQTIALWNDTAAREGYKEMTIESFRETFTKNKYFNRDGAFVSTDEQGKVDGFACGIIADDLPYGDKGGFLTCAISAQFDKTAAESISEALTARVEAFFTASGKTQSNVIFFNPIMLPWYIKDTPKHEHNNAPGAPTDGSWYKSLLRGGYEVRSVERAMYLNLSDFTKTEYMYKKEAGCSALGYEVVLYDKTRHTGLAQSLAAYHNPLWEREIQDAADKGVPFLVAAVINATSASGVTNAAVAENESYTDVAANLTPASAIGTVTGFAGPIISVAGFAGPIIPSPSGRGYFSGIAVHPDHEKRGLGSVLFYNLCDEFKKAGARYMSLYTGVNNPALHIYEKAGFRPAREFAVMRKELAQSNG